MPDAANPLKRERVQHLPLSKLHLDTSNPRFGALAGQSATETEVLDTIVEQFGIEDVLSSIAVNGFFESEPLVGIELTNGDVRVLEGNRRLAACLVLADDPRAVNQGRRREAYSRLQAEHGRTVKEIPVLVYDEEDREKLLPYLGVRHIAGSQPWDSYAKATWVAQVLEAGNLTIPEISQMVGDTHRTVARIVEGYYFINQLLRLGKFSPSESLRRGRGSNPDFPFSWVYSALGHTQIREWLGLQERTRPQPNPIPLDRLDRGQDLLIFLFGHRGRGTAPAVPDTRDLSDLALCLADPELVRELYRGKSVHEVRRLSKPSHQRITDHLLTAIEQLAEAYAVLGQEQIEAEEADSLLQYARRLSKLVAKISEELQKSTLPITSIED
jgi:ParB-like chromosome segregation protein Spo0J